MLGVFGFLHLETIRGLPKMDSIRKRVCSSEQANERASTSWSCCSRSRNDIPCRKLFCARVLSSDTSVLSLRSEHGNTRCTHV